MKKTIVFFGFQKKQILYLKKQFNQKVNFLTHNSLKGKKKIKIDAVVGITTRFKFLKDAVKEKIYPKWIHLLCCVKNIQFLKT